MTTVRVPEQKCACGEEIEFATSFHGQHVPDDEGDSIVVCVGCGAVYRYGKGFVLEPVDVGTLDATAQTAIERARRLIATARRTTP